MSLPHEPRVWSNIWSISFVFFSAIIYYNLRYRFATTSEHKLRWQLAIYDLSLDVSSGISLHNICSTIIHHHFHTNPESSHALAFQKSRIYSTSSKSNPTQNNLLKDFLPFAMFYYHLFRNPNHKLHLNDSLTSPIMPYAFVKPFAANISSAKVCVYTTNIR